MTYEELMDDLRAIDRLAWAAGIALEDVDRPVVVAARRVAALFGDAAGWAALADVEDWQGRDGMSESALSRHFFGEGR